MRAAIERRIVGPATPKRVRCLAYEIDYDVPEYHVDEKYVLPTVLRTKDDVVSIIDHYDGIDINVNSLRKILPALEELDELVGLTELKEAVYDNVMYYAQHLNRHTKRIKKDQVEGDLLHTVLLGPPGRGKTVTANILAKIYSGLMFGTQKVVNAKRSDLIGKYIGHTESRTEEILKSAENGVLVLDEVYSLAGADGHIDVFAKACIDLIMRYLTEHKRDFVCIIIGYEKETQGFFDTNPGLKRRFPWRFILPEYTPEDLCCMFVKRLNKEEWNITDEAICELKRSMQKYSQVFLNAGGDMDVLFTTLKLTYSRRRFGKGVSTREFDVADISCAINSFVSTRDEHKDESWKHMYA